MNQLYFDIELTDEVKNGGADFIAQIFADIVEKKYTEQRKSCSGKKRSDEEDNDWQQTHCSE